MDIKEIRDALKGVVDTVPRSNEDAEELYNEIMKSESDAEPKSKNIYTYVGYGDEPPQITNFMGRQTFVRGIAAEVTDPLILSKIDGNMSFIKGKCEPAHLLENDLKEKAKANAQIEEDQKTQIEVERRQRKAS